MGDRPDPAHGNRLTAAIDDTITPLSAHTGAEVRLRASLEKALGLAQDVVLVSFEGGRERLMSRRMACVRCDVSVPELSPRAFSFNIRPRIFPLGDFGIRSMNSTARIFLYGATRAATKSINSAAEICAPSSSTTHAIGISPALSSGAPTTAASRTAGCDCSKFSNSAGAT